MKTAGFKDQEGRCSSQAEGCNGNSPSLLQISAADEERGGSYLTAYTARARCRHRLQHVGQTAGGLGRFPGSGSGRSVAGEVAQLMGGSRHPACGGGTSPSPGSSSSSSSTCRTPAAMGAGPQHPPALLPARPAGLGDAKQCPVASKTAWCFWTNATYPARRGGKAEGLLSYNLKPQT